MHCANALVSMVVRLLVPLVPSKVTDTKAVHRPNALIPIVSTLAGIVIDVIAVPVNVVSPIV